VPQYRLTRFRGGWAVSIWERGARLHRYSLGKGNRKAAERIFHRFVTDRERPDTITVAYIWQHYRDENAHKRIAANMAFSGKAVLPEFGHLTPDEITDAKTRAYTRKRTKAGRKPGTVWTELNHLQVALNWAAKKNVIPRGVALERPAKPPPRDRRLTRAEARRLLDAAGSPHIALAIALMLGTGARIGAILDLTWSRVDLDAGLISYTDPDATGRRKGRATVPMTPDLVKRLTEARRGAVTDYVIEWAAKQVHSIKRGFAHAVAKAGLTNVTPHVLRHTAACRLAESGAPMSEIAQILGHSDSRTTERIYARFSPLYLRKAIAALDMSESGVPGVSGEPVNQNEDET
jgi:integrase